MSKTFLILLLVCLSNGFSKAEFVGRLPKTLESMFGHLLKRSSDLEARVVGGQNAEIGEAPYQISLMKNYGIVKSHMCGGSLYNEQTVITAAHCTYGQKASSLLIRYGTNKRSQPKYSDMKVAEIRQHADYNPNTIENDISLLILANKIKPSENVQFIEIEQNDMKGADPVTVYGWGFTQGNSQSLPDDLQKGQLKVIDSKECNEIWGSVNAIVDGMICSWDETQTACNGDSGGPLVSTNKKLVGIVSWGASGCPVGLYPGVFTRAKYYYKWIEENKKD